MNKPIKATIIHLIVALLITTALIGVIYLLFGREVDTALILANKITVDIENKKEEVVTINTTKKTLETYPEYGTKYADIEIPAIDVNLPVYYGEDLQTLKKGVGHSSGSYFPGEGGSIVYMGHNFAGFFRRFGELEIGDSIKITTNYGVYNYRIYDLKLINETNVNAIPIQHDEEILMIFTCYPFNNVGYASQRYVVYAEVVEE